MNQMFYGASAFNADISAWDVQRVTEMGSMFHGASAFDDCSKKALGGSDGDDGWATNQEFTRNYNSWANLPECTAAAGLMPS